jgi:hypothetical protein
VLGVAVAGGPTGVATAAAVAIALDATVETGSARGGMSGNSVTSRETDGGRAETV